MCEPRPCTQKSFCPKEKLNQIFTFLYAFVKKKKEKRKEEKPLNFGMFMDISKDSILTLATLSKSMLLRQLRGGRGKFRYLVVQ